MSSGVPNGAHGGEPRGAGSAGVVGRTVENHVAQAARALQGAVRLTVENHVARAARALQGSPWRTTWRGQQGRCRAQLGSPYRTTWRRQRGRCRAHRGEPRGAGSAGVAGLTVENHVARAARALQGSPWRTTWRGHIPAPHISLCYLCTPPSVWYRTLVEKSSSSHKITLFVAFIAAVLFVHGSDRLAASENERVMVLEADAVVETIRVEGLGKTKESIVLDIVAVEVGDTITPDEVQRIEDDLVKSGLFAAVTVEAFRPANAPTMPASDSIDLRIEVDEKWTLVPIPFFSSGGDGFSGGLILLESNLFGRNKQLVSAGFAGTAGASGFFLYSDPSVFRSQFSTSLSAAIGTDDVETVRPDGEEIRSYSVDSQTAGFGVGYRLTPQLQVRTRLGVARWSIDDFDAGLDDDEIEDGSYLEPQVTLGYERTRPIDVLLVGPTASVDARWVTLEQGWEVSGRASIGVPLFQTHRVRVMTSGGYGSMPAIAESPISARDGFRTLPYQQTLADRWVSGAVFYDLPVVSADWGAFVLSHYWEGGGYDTDVIEPQGFFGPGGGFRVYIRQVAIPAVGLDIAYNIIDPAWVFSFTVGARM
jgi:hypothetical protein